MTTVDRHQQQAVLESENITERLQLAHELITKEKVLANIQRQISQQVDQKVTKQHREYMLREQIKTINKELGVEKDDKEEMIKRFVERLDSFRSSVPPVALKAIEDELGRISTLEKNSPELSVSRTYLDWLTSIPWGKMSNDELNLTYASTVMNKDHYALDDVKKRLLEFIAVAKLRRGVGGNILCFVGPPGVGKTSIAKSIAEALNRKFYRFSVGGLHDIAEIKGHRRTYIGAMPGKPVISLKSSGTMNPVILIDEVNEFFHKILFGFA